MRKEDLKHQLFTIPNLLTYLRLLAVPVFMAFTIAKSTYILRSDAFPQGFPLIGLIIMLVAASTDLFDGAIARKFNQVSDLGKMLDPLADKVMHCGALLSLVIAGHIHWAFLVVLLLKEGTMVVGGVFMMTNSKLIQANYMGKVASFVMSIACFMSYFHDFFAARVFYLDWIVLGIGLVLTYIAFFNYLRQAIVIIKGIFARKKAMKNGEVLPDEEEGAIAAAETEEKTAEGEKEDE